jgi:hypothetical protein
VVWDEQLTYRLEHGEEFLSHYHQRSNAEATMSMIKRVLGERIRSKDEIAQINELLAKIISHNIRCVIRRAGNKADERLICRSGEGADRQIIDLTDEYVF